VATTSAAQRLTIILPLVHAEYWPTGDHAPTGSSLAVTLTLTSDQLELIARQVARWIDEGRDDGFLDVDGAAAFLGGCSRKAVYHLVERGRTRAHRVGGRLLFDPAELRADLERGD
jgi:excisionase family DNA binding protein